MRLIAFVFFLVVSLVPVAQAAPDWLRPDAAYSATRTMTAGGHQISGPLYYDSGKERFEMTVEDTTQVMIRREDRDRLYMVMPQMGIGMEMKLSGPKTTPSPQDYVALEPEVLGRETLNGEEVTKYRVDAKDAGQSYTVFIWATDDGIPLRMEGATAEGSFQMALTDLQRGPQPAELFELPAGIQLMAMPGQ